MAEDRELIKLVIANLKGEEIGARMDRSCVAVERAAMQLGLRLAPGSQARRPVQGKVQMTELVRRDVHWQQPEDEQLRELAHTGMTAAQIARLGNSIVRPPLSAIALHGLKIVISKSAKI